MAALRSYRAGGGVPPANAGSASDPEAARADRLEAALRSAPLTKMKTIVLKKLLEASPRSWVPFNEVQAEFSKESIQPERASAAIRDLSTQMGNLPPEDISGLARKIEVLAERSRVGGEYRYRLTRAGRLAVARVVTQ